MDIFNHITCSFFDAVCFPFAALHPLWGLISISVLTGIFMLLIFRFTSDQKGIQEIKNRIKAYFFEIRLFKDDLGLMFEAQKNILKANLTYMKYSLKPMLFLIVPVVLIMIQLSLRFDRQALTIGESAIVKLKFKDSAFFHEEVTLKVPEGTQVDAPPLRIREKKEINWRIKPEKKGIYDLKFELTPGTFSKSLIVDDRLVRLSTRRVSPNLTQQLLHPGEKSLPAASGIDYIEILYPPIAYYVLGWRIHWLIIFFIVSIATGFILKGFLKVEV